MPVGFDLFE